MVLLKLKRILNLANLIQVKIIIIGLILQFFIILLTQYNKYNESTDKYLSFAATSIKYYLREDFLNGSLNKKTYSKAELYKKFTYLDKRSEDIGVDKAFIIFRDKGRFYYPVRSSDPNEIYQLKDYGYWSLISSGISKKINILEKALDSNDPIFISFKEDKVSYRGVVKKEVSSSGKEYLAGSITSLSNRKMVIYRETFQIFLPFLILFLILIPLGFIFQKNIEEKEDLYATLKEVSTHDKLTGTYNRWEGIKLLKAIIYHKHQFNISISLCIFSIDNLTDINRLKGLKSGDQYILDFLTLVKEHFRITDKLIRIEGNKFLLILEGFEIHSSNRLEKRFKHTVEEFNSLSDRLIPITYTSYVEEYRSGDIDMFIDEMLVQLKKAKVLRKESHNGLIIKLIDGLEQKEFTTYFQPKIDLLTGKLSFEALIRWIHPEDGFISPGLFIPIIEKHNLINEITRIVIKDSIDALKRLNKHISVNLSSKSLKDEMFFREIFYTLKERRVKEGIMFEITEHSSIDNLPFIQEKIRQLKEVGVTFAIDDFGTGYSSLSYLDQLTIDEVKIDRSLVRDITTSKVNQTIVEAILKLSLLKDFNVICEGVEEKQQIEKLISLGVSSFQGFYFDKPRPIEEIEEKINIGYYKEKISEFKINIRSEYF